MKAQHVVVGMTLSAMVAVSIPAVSYAQTTEESIQAGSTGSAVVLLQNDLNALGFTVGQADGQFGVKTTTEVEAFQKAHKLTADGVVGPATWKAIDSAVAPMVTKPVALSASSKAAKSIEIKHIYYNNKLITSPYGFTYDSTDYMPIWYVMNTLDKEGFTHTWSGNVWNIIVPNATSQSINYSNIHYGKGSMAIAINGTVVARVIGVTHVDPASKSTTTFMPIYYVEKALDRVGITSTWNGTTWKMTSSGSQGGGTSTSVPYGNVDLRFPAPSSITASSIDSYFAKSAYQGSVGSPLTGLGASFIDAQKTYGVDATYLVAHALFESAYGLSSIAQQDNNLFGYGAFTDNPGQDAGVFPSDDYAIRFQAWEVRNNYLNPGSSNYGGEPTLTGMNVNYASDQNWASGVGSLMGQISASVGLNSSNYQSYSASNAAPAPSSTSEPVYYLNGATATTKANTDYSGLPYYASVTAGQNDMFFGPLENGSFGHSVSELQKYLNSTMNAGLTVDGQFGTSTETAVKAFEAAKGLPQDGIWSFSMWQTYIDPLSNTPTLPAGQSVNVDEIAQGMAGGYVVPWYHIANVGWVDSQYVQLTNVYRVIAANPLSANTSISVYSDTSGTQSIATLHSGDFVVASSPTATNGMYEIQFAAETAATSGGKTPGTLMTGYVSAQRASLSAQS